jgi:hypothetical protein
MPADKIADKMVDTGSNAKKCISEPAARAEETHELEDKFRNLLDNFDNETLKEELLKELKSPENLKQMVNVADKSENNTMPEKAQKVVQDLDQVKLRISEKYKCNTDNQRQSTIAIPIDESLKLFNEQTKHLQVMSPSYDHSWF